MYIGENFPIVVTDTSNPPLIILEENVAIVVSNNKVPRLTFKSTDGDAGIKVETVDGRAVITAEGITRAQSLEFTPGQIEIEVLIKTTDPDFPLGFFQIGKFTEPVLPSTSTLVAL